VRAGVPWPDLAARLAGEVGADLAVDYLLWGLDNGFTEDPVRCHWLLDILPADPRRPHLQVGEARPLQ